jgi:antirestriction protein ArdC
MRSYVQRGAPGLAELRRRAHRGHDLKVAREIAAEFSIDGDMRSAGYIADCIKLLRHDSKAIFTYASKAQVVVDYLRDLVLREPAQAAE